MSALFTLLYVLRTDHSGAEDQGMLSDVDLAALRKAFSSQWHQGKQWME